MGIPNIELLTPDDDPGVLACLNGGAEILVTHVWEDEYLSPSLRWIASTSAGYDQYPLARLRENDVRLTTASGAASIVVAEHAFALLLSLTRRVGEFSQNMVHRKWEPLVGDELYEKKLAIIGLGRIGEEIARRASCWGMEVMGLKRNPCAYQGCVRDVRSMDALNAACSWADVLIICAPGSPGSAPLISAAELKRLGSGYLINVGRGSLLDLAALAESISNGQLLGAGLDVTSPEPLPADSSLWSSSKVIISAHSAGRSRKYGSRWGDIFSHNLQAFQKTPRWTNLIENER